MTANTSFALEPSLELELLRLWNKFLNRSDLTVDDDLFESGGDSLLATELLIEVERLNAGDASAVDFVRDRDGSPAG